MCVLVLGDEGETEVKGVAQRGEPSMQTSDMVVEDEDGKTRSTV